MEQLGLINPKVFVSSFDRPNLSLNVLPGKDKLRKIVTLIDRHRDDSGIIYCLSRKETERLASKLVRMGINAGAYHAGLDTVIRNQVQEAFINDQISVICATVAFGMGIDKSNVRWIIHHNLPKNIEAFYQQIGRAGRDGLPSETLLLYSTADFRILNKFISEGGQSKLMSQKLKRMQHYAEAITCRRRLLLSYFNEHLNSDCGNCDVCLQPPKRVDGTEMTKKVLEMILEGKETIRERALIRKMVARNTQLNHLIAEKLLLQLINLGLVEIAYDKKGVLKVTNYGREVLDNKYRIELVATNQMHVPKLEKPSSRYSQRRFSRPNSLFNSLRRFRKSIARNKGVPPYLIFDDAVLNHLANQQPKTLEEMINIPGIGTKKLEQFGTLFLNKIKDFNRFDIEPQSAQNNTTSENFQQVLRQFREGISVKKIAHQLKTEETTVHEILLTHLAEGESLDSSRLITEFALNQIEYVVRVTGNKENIKDLFEDLNQAIPIHTIKYGLALLERAHLLPE